MALGDFGKLITVGRCLLAGKQHPGEFLKVLPLEFFYPGQGMFLGQGEQEGFLPPVNNNQVLDGLQRSGPDKPAIEFSRLEGPHLSGRAPVVQFHQAGRVIFPELLDQPGKFHIQVPSNKGEAETARFSLAIAPNRPGGVVNMTKNGPRILQETSPRLGQSNRVGIAGENYGPEFLLQSLDLTAERRLGKMQLSGCLGKAEVVRNGDEAFKLAHGDPVHAKKVIYSGDHSNFVSTDTSCRSSPARHLPAFRANFPNSPLLPQKRHKFIQGRRIVPGTMGKNVTDDGLRMGQRTEHDSAG